MRKIDFSLTALTKILGLYSFYFVFSIFQLRIFGIEQFPLPMVNEAICILMSICAFNLLFEKHLIISYLLIYLGIVYFSFQYPLVHEVHWNYLNWIFLILIAIQFTSKNLKTIHPFINSAFWISYGLAYSILGFLKLHNPAYISGETFRNFFKWCVDANIAPTFFLDVAVLKYCAVLVAIIQLSAFLLITFKRGRIILLVIFSLFHFSVFFFTFMKNVALGMLIVQFLAICMLKQEARYHKFLSSYNVSLK